ncbi:hypothetical protein [Maridesulfovibrio sp.]|uniref:hypothetical protein n=1 Tax=Maridesulfovibrio sp. TaxID=2795000 RepID=UPI0029C9C580|nr:hypothetical protein [Maridesulfovibrio sp.]
MSTDAQCIRIHLPADAAWAGLMQAAAEHSGRVFGLDSARTLRLVHCAEELLLYLASAETDAIEAIFRPICTGVEIGVFFDSKGVDLSAMNLAFSPDSCGDDRDWTSLPLLLAARMSDGFRVGLEGRRMEIALRVDKTYPEPDLFPVESFLVQGQITFSVTEDSGALLEACSSISALHSPHVVPVWCACPGKAADLVRAGELNAMEARDETGRLCGIIFWQKRSEQSVTFFGPYDFSFDGSVAGGLINSMLQAVGRTKTKNIFSSLATQPLADYGFELLAELPYMLEGETAPVIHSVWGRMLQEDYGATAWTHEGFADFLRSCYESLELLRDLRPVSNLGETVHTSSVIGARFTPVLSEVFLYPELNGADIGENISEHVASLVSAGYRNIFFEIDLAKGWHAAMGEYLLRSGFRPELLLPHGGQSDTLIFRYAAES